MKEKKIAHWIGGILIGITLLVALMLHERNKPPEKTYGQVTPDVAAVPTYPIVKWVKIHRGVWSSPIVISKMERMDWTCYDNIVLLVSDGGKVYRQDSDHHRLDMEGIRDRRATSFMIDPKTDLSVTEADMKCTISER